MIFLEDYEYFRTELGVLYKGDNVEIMKSMQHKSVDLVITSPPYDNLRKYKGYSFDFENVAKQLFRIIKDNGVIVWVVGDSVINGSETGTSFKQALFFKEIGFNLHDTMIYEKNSSTFPARKNGNRYSQIFEYMFIFSKGKVKASLICDKKNKWAGHTSFDKKIPPVPDFSPRTNIWKYTTSFNKKTGHPAVFPEKLVLDNITTWGKKMELFLILLWVQELLLM